MGRWHRPRWGIWRFRREGRGWNTLSWQLWCGYHFYAGTRRVLTATTVPVGDQLCGTCEGRAVGAGYPPVGIEPISDLIYDPWRDVP
jgi:hypothetical protein